MIVQINPCGFTDWYQIVIIYEAIYVTASGNQFFSSDMGQADPFFLDYIWLSPNWAQATQYAQLWTDWSSWVMSLSLLPGWW